MMDKAKNDIILATLAKHGGSCTFEVIMEVAEGARRRARLPCIAVLPLLPRPAAE
jgi:hypothetical protein